MISKTLRAAAAIAALALTTPALAQQAVKQDPRFGLGVGITSSRTHRRARLRRAVLRAPEPRPEPPD